MTAQHANAQDSPAGSEAVQVRGTTGTSDADGKRPQADVSEQTAAGLEQKDWAACDPPRAESSSSLGAENGVATSGKHLGSNDEKDALRLREEEVPAQSTPDTRRHPDEISPVDTSESAEAWPDEKADYDPTGGQPKPEPVVLRFKKGRWGRYVPVPEQKLRNNLSGAVGYLEFANALDFAANVWNTIPVPTFAAALMGLGGATAIILSLFAWRDGVKAWRNVRLLRSERAHLKGVAKDEEKAAQMIDGYDLDVKIEVNRRELGQEIVDRFAMDVFMGFSSFIVGVGTLLAIGGANPRVFHASNLLSGYIGNSPAAFWGLGNTLWSAYLFRRARRHFLIGTRDLHHEVVKERLRRRTNAVRFHSFVMGLSTLVSAPAGIITAENWQGYPPLIPCIILAKWGNVIWRRRLGYTRFPISAAAPSVNPGNLIAELEWTIALQEALRGEKKAKVQWDVDKHRGKESITSFMNKCGLLESLCNRLLRQGHIKHDGLEVVEVDQAAIEGYESTVPEFAQMASTIFQRKGLRVLAYRERHLLELLGASVYDAAVRRRQSISRQETARV